MSITRECAIEVIKRMPEYKLEAFLALFADENEIARIETEMLANNPDAKCFNSVEELLEDLRS